MRRPTPLILVVDDTEANRFVVAGILSRAGYVVIQAGTGAQAMENIDERPDLIVLDVRLPDTTGYEIARLVRQRPEHDTTPLLFISASFTGPGAHAQGLDSGADGYLTHPVDPGVLLATVRALLRVRRSEEAFRVLADASQAFSQSLDPEELPRALAKIAASRIADACVVCQFTDEGVAVAAAVHARDDHTLALQNVLATYPPRLEASDVMATPFLQHTPTAYAPTGERGQALAAMGLKAAVTVPLIARAHAFGSVTFLVESLTVDAITMRTFMDVAARASLAIDNARLYRVADDARTEAQIANSAKMDFLAAMSHELRTPLNAITGYVELLAMGLRGPVTDAQHDDLRRIAQNEHHLASLIEDILNYAKLEAGRIEFDISPVDVGAALADVASLMSAPYGTKGVSLHFKSDESNITALGDSDRLRQVLLNLLSNAVKFTPPGGSVSLTGRVEGPIVQISCEDSGLGIPPDKLEAIFEPFVQVSKVPMGQRAGLGLGLAISRDLMRGMQGDLIVASELGKGSTFTLVLPAA
jgi:signal transduction histidine kinase/AmiR/NasT family two-component response regulator